MSPDKRSSWLSDTRTADYNEELETKCREGAMSAADRLNQEIRSRKTPSAPSTPTEDGDRSPTFAATMSKKSSFMDLDTYRETTGMKKGQGVDYPCLRLRLAGLQGKAR